MSYYQICPRCKAHLDPGEKCDCVKRPAVKKESNPKAFVWTAEYQRMKQRLIASLS